MGIFGSEMNILEHPEKTLRPGEIFAPILRLGNPDSPHIDKRLLSVLPLEAHLDPKLLADIRDERKKEFELIPGTRFAIKKQLLSDLLPNSGKKQSALAQGSYGAILPGRDTRFNKDVVFKVFIPFKNTIGKVRARINLQRSDEASQIKGLDRFYKEARLMANLTHPHIAKIHDLTGFIIGNYFFPAIVMDRYDKSLLANKGKRVEDMKFVHLSQSQLTVLARQIGSALDHIHKHSIIHCDIKPENIFMKGEEQFFLGDFGIAVGDYRPQGGTFEQTGGGLITEAPEQMFYKMRSMIGPATDQHQLAVTLYLLMGGSPLAYLYPGRKQASEDHIRPEQVLNPQNIPPRVYSILNKGMSWEPTNRYPSCGEFAEAFIETLGKD